MRKLFTALFALCLGVSQCLATSILLTGAGKQSSGGGGVTGWCSLIQQSGLTNCWPWDSTYTTTGTAQDPIGGKNATLTSVTLNGSGPGTHLNNAGVFNGTTSHGDTTGTTTLLTGSTWTLVMWTNFNIAGASGNRLMANDHTDSDHNGFQVAKGSSNCVSSDIGNGTTDNGTTTASNCPATTAWHCLAWTYSGGTLTPYLDGTAGTTAALTGPVTSGSNSMSFGFNPSYSGDFYNGMLAGVAIYGSTALTSGQVSTLCGIT